LHSSFLSLISHPPTSPLFPYTTLFRSFISSGSFCSSWPANNSNQNSRQPKKPVQKQIISWFVLPRKSCQLPTITQKINSLPRSRSEEHTSELQSRFDLVCRLLLEKKNK